MSTQERKQRERERRREEIMSATQHLIVDGGYDNVTMQDIADAVEISKGGLYLHFRDKESIVAALVGRSLAEFDVMITEELGKAGTAPERLEHVGRAYWRFFMEKPESFASFSLIPNLIGKPQADDQRQEVASQLERLEAILRKTFEEGRREGSIRAGFDTQLQVATMTLLVNCFMEKLAKLPGASGSILGYGSEELIQALFDILLFYIRGEHHA